MTITIKAIITLSMAIETGVPRKLSTNLMLTELTYILHQVLIFLYDGKNISLNSVLFLL